MFELRVFQNFLKVIALGSVSRAADHVGLTQPALSQQIAALEAEFKVPLLHRTPKGVQPTNAGLIVAARLQVIVRQIDAAREEIRSSRQAPTGIVAIGMPNSVAEILSVPLVTACRLRFPGIRLRIAAVPNRWLADQMLAGRMDFAILFGSEPYKALRHCVLGEEHLYLLRSAEHAQKTGARQVQLAALAESRLVLPCRPHLIRAILDRQCGLSNIKLQVLAEVDSLSNIIELVATGQFESVLPWSAIFRHIDSGIIDATPFDAHFNRTVSLSTLAEVPLSEVAAEVLRLTIEVMGDMVEDARWQGFDLIDRAGRASLADALTGAGGAS